MRIVAGSARGRRLVAPPGDSTRPTTERVREATFNALFSLGEVEDRTFCDLFAGSGALGLEALSRGATSVTFVERDRAALEALRTNITALGFDDQATVITGEALGWLMRSPAHDVLLADPPYDFDSWPLLLTTAAERDYGLVIAEAGDEVEAIAPWGSLRVRAYGSTVVTILDRDQKPPDAKTKESTA